MQKWEYCIAKQRLSPEGEPPEPVKVSVQGRDEEYEVPTLAQALSSLGEDGWELVGHSPVFVGWSGQGMQKVTDNYIFKRQTDEQTPS